jgi:UDP-N-acetylmuramoyl-tripeptide--D-alanyl-D-alanine ligase
VIKLNQLGRHNVYNALAACAASMSAGCDLTHVKQGLESFNNVSGRLEKKTGPDGSVIFDDTYNANPGSVRAGIEAIQQIKKEAVLILGDMGELGEDSKNLHYQLGIDAAQRGIKKLFAVGQLTEATCDGFNSVTEGSKQQAKHFTDKESLVEYALRTLNNKNVVLVKGSRTMGMESIVNELVRSGKMNNNLKGVQ